ncbi:unnamed protein product, partial [marine sediment metagenome]
TFIINLFNIINITYKYAINDIKYLLLKIL